MEVSGRRASPADEVDQSSTGQFDKSCQPCAVDGQHKNAQGYCTNCDEYLCGDCYKYHRNLKVTKNHVLVDMADMPHCNAPSLEASDALDDKLIDTCTEHAGKIVEYYCKTHIKTACAVCVTLYHRNCSDVQYIPDIAAGTSDSHKCKDIMLELNLLTFLLTDIEFRAGESIEAVEKASDAYSQQVQTYRDQLVAIIDKLAAEAEDKQKTYVHKLITRLNSIRKVSQDNRHSIEAVISQIKDRRLAVQEKMLFVSLKQAGILATDCQNYITSVENNVYASRIEFKNNTKLYDMLRNVRSLGDIDTSIQLTVEIDVQCNISALHSLSDGRLIVSEKKSMSVKLFDSNYRLKSRVQLQSYPWDMAQVSSGEVAVLLPDSQKIQFLSTSGDLSPGRTINTNIRSPYSAPCMAVNRDIILLLTHTTDTLRLGCIVKLDLNGRKLKTIDISYINIQMKFSVGYDIDGYQYIDHPYIRIHPTNNNIYVSNGSNGRVTCMTQQGEWVAEYKDAELKYPQWLAIHADGSVYVCGLKSNNIHHITAECKKIDVILGHGEIKNPWCICFDLGGKLLYVSEIKNNKLKVFRLFL